MTSKADGADALVGDLKMGDKTFMVELTSGGANGRLTLMPTEGTSFMSLSSMPLSADRIGEGATRCSPAPVS